MAIILKANKVNLFASSVLFDFFYHSPNFLDTPHMPKPVYEEGDVTVLCNQAVHTGREVAANRSGIIIKNKKRRHTH
jgi:hypothetical protein